MGETNTDDAKDTSATDNGGGDQSDTTTEDGADTSKNTDANDAGDSDDDSSDADDGDDAEDGSDDGKGNSSDTESSDTADDDTTDADDGVEPEIRKPKAGATNAEWAAWRKQEKAKADSADKKGKQGAAAEDGAATDDASGSDDPVAKEVAKQLAPFHAQAAEQEVNAEIAAFIASNPDFKPFETKAKRFAMHPSRQNVPIKSIFYEVAGDKLLKIGADRKTAADAKARKTRTGGGSNANADGQGNKSYKDMPLDDFGKELDAVKTAPRSR